MATALYNIFIMPLQLFIELVFSVTNFAFNNVGLSIFGVSVAVQILCFPLYKRADDIQTEDREKQKEMKPWLDHIKKTFKGDERFMMQQTYYRSVNYKPIYAVKGSISLLLQIPFFIAAYNFLSNLKLLKGAVFLGISDLSQPDQLIHIGGITLNLLPILMTFFNVISGIIYLRGLPVKDKIQTYGLAAVFLVILYRSPSGLVLYWTLNNFFSLFKNVFLKLVKHPKTVISVGLLLAGIVLVVYNLFFDAFVRNTKLLVFVISVLCILIAVLMNFKPKFKSFVPKVENTKLINSIFYFSLLTLTVLVGIFVPVSAVKTSPTEFISTNYGPFGLLANNFYLSIGLFGVWVNIFYVLSTPKIKKVFSIVLSSLTICCIANVLLFGHDLGTMSAYFVFDKEFGYSVNQIIINVLITVALIVFILLLYRFKVVAVKRIYQITAISLTVVSVINLVSIGDTLSREGYFDKDNNIVESKEAEPIIKLSKNGKNVIVFMLDRAISGYIPFFIENYPELKETYDGFTYYPNTISYGGRTNFGTPALFGGYEYIPTEMNRRSDETLESKHNEALTVLPRLFSENGFSAVVLDPPYAGYCNIPDLSIYEEYSSIKAYNTIGAYSKSEKLSYVKRYEASQKRNMGIYSLMRCLPVGTQWLVYQKGYYWSTDYSTSGLSKVLDNFSVLKNLNNLTDVSNNTDNSFVMIQNSTTHEPTYYNVSDCKISTDEQDKQLTQKGLKNGEQILLDKQDYIIHYETNLCSLKQIGKWLDYLRDNNIYDRTKIIIVSDHGMRLGQFDYMCFENGIDVQEYNPLLLVKDFNAKGFKTSYDFMTNADTPTLAVNGTIDNPVNPFTGKLIDNSVKSLQPQIITTSGNYRADKNSGNTFDTSDGEWWSVQDNIFDVNNWQKVEVN